MEYRETAFSILCSAEGDVTSSAEQLITRWTYGVSQDICDFEKMVVYLHHNNSINPLKVMNNADFWASIRSIIADGFTPDGLQKLDRYAE